MQNANFDILRFCLEVLRDYFPMSLKYILVVDIPWILKAFWTMVKTWLPRNSKNMIKFTSRAEITNYIAAENLPDFLGGICKRPYQGMKMVPHGSPSALEFGEKVLKLPHEKCVKIWSFYKPYVDEIELEAGLD